MSLYSLPESENDWNRTFKRHIQEEVHVSVCSFNPPFFCKTEDQELGGVCGLHVENNLHGINNAYFDNSKKPSL